MIYVGIDAAKDKHDCMILGPAGEVLLPAFTFQNNKDGFENLFKLINFFFTRYYPGTGRA